MDTERNLLFGVVALQNGTVDADRLAETCAAWASKPDKPLADVFVGRGLMTDEQKTEVERVVARELESHGGDAQATLAATIDGRALEAMRDIPAAAGSLKARLTLPPQAQGGHVVLEKLSPADAESRERYTLTHLHAKGGMGRVWLARDSALGRQIALKELRPDQADNSIVWSRFMYEAKITAQLEHPGIVPVYEVGEGDSPYYTMRFVKGRTLCESTRAYHKKRAAGQADSLGMVELLNAFVGVCHAVAYAHSRGIIHRDLKGQNVVLGDFGEVMVLDWGLAKRIGPDQEGGGGGSMLDETADPAALAAAPGETLAGDHDDARTLPEGHDERLGLAASSHPGSNGHASSSNGHASSSNGHASGSNGHVQPHSGSSRRPSPESGAGPDGTMQGQLLGTPAYMAPEQAQGRHDLVDERTDVYGLGAILYEILTGRPPFIAPKTKEIIRKVCQEEASPPRQIVPTIGPGLEAVCLKALSKDREARYPSAAELALEVQRYIADEPVRAYAEPLFPRVLRWARRHKTLVSTAAGLVATATVALAVSTVLVSRERDEAAAQGQQARQAVNMLTRVKDIGFEDQLDPVQEDFLKSALAYYAQFTGRVSRDPAVLLEHGLAYQQMGDIERKLGKSTDSEKSYRKAIEILEPLATAAGAGPEPKRALARARTLLGNLLFRGSAAKDQIEGLYRQAVDAQQALADAPAATVEDCLHLGQTLKSQGDLLRLNGKFAEAKPLYDRAIAMLEKALATDGKHNEVRNELALASDARGWSHRDLGEIKSTEKDYRRALDLLEALVAEFPTMPRYRESLAKAYNSLGLLEHDAGNLVDAETYFRRELPLVERLSQDFPKRPEHGRELARTLSNLGNVLSMKRDAGAEGILRRAVDVNTPLAAKHPEDVQIRFDLSKDHQCLSSRLYEQGDFVAAIASMRQARAISEALVKEFPEKPRYAELLAMNLAGLALALNTSGQPNAQETFLSASAIYDKLVQEHPDVVDYRIGYAHCLRAQAAVLAGNDHPEQAEVLYRKALGNLETKDAKALTPAWLRMQAVLLSNLGDLNRPGGEEALRRSIAISEGLLKHAPPANEDLQNLAIAQNNLGNLFMSSKRLAEAASLLAQAVANFEKLVADSPDGIDFQSRFGIVLASQGDCLIQSGKPGDAKTALESAVEHQRLAVKLSKNAPVYRELVGEHLVKLAQVDLELAAYDDAAKIALDLPKTLPASKRAHACFQAAGILARVISRVDGDSKLTQRDRDRLTRNNLGRTVVLLRDAIDSDPKISDQIKADADIKRLESKPEFQTIMNTMVKLGQ